MRSGGIPLRHLQGLELLAQLIDGDHRIQSRRVGIPGVIDADQLRLRGAAGDGEHRAPAVSRGEQRVDHEVGMVPAALGVMGQRVEHLAGVQGREGAERKAAHLDQIAGSQRAGSAHPVRHHRQQFARLQHSDVRLRIDQQLGQQHVARLVVVGLVPHDLQLLPHLLRARRHAVDRVVLVRHFGLAGDMLVGDQVRFSVQHPIGEPSPVHDGA